MKTMTEAVDIGDVGRNVILTMQRKLTEKSRSTTYRNRCVCAEERSWRNHDGIASLAQKWFSIRNVLRHYAAVPARHFHVTVWLPLAGE
jgi:hypothetical protein